MGSLTRFGFPLKVVEPDFDEVGSTGTPLYFPPSPSDLALPVLGFFPCVVGDGSVVDQIRTGVAAELSAARCISNLDDIHFVNLDGSETQQEEQLRNGSLRFAVLFDENMADCNSKLNYTIRSQSQDLDQAVSTPTSRYRQFSAFNVTGFSALQHSVNSAWASCNTSNHTSIRVAQVALPRGAHIPQSVLSARKGVWFIVIYCRFKSLFC